MSWLSTHRKRLGFASLPALAAAAILWGEHAVLGGFLSPLLVDSTVRSRGLDAVQACAQQVAVGATRSVQYDWKQRCALHPDAQHPYPFAAEHADYTLIRDDDLIDAGSPTLRRIGALATIDLSIVSPAEQAWEQLGPKAKRGPRPTRLSEGRRAKIVADTRACMDPVNRYWGHYGLELRFTYVEHADGAPYTANSVAVIDGPGRSNSHTFYYDGLAGGATLPFGPKGYQLPAGPTELCLSTSCLLTPEQATNPDAACASACDSTRQLEYCSMVTHELGHRLGLPDEYADPMCPDRKVVAFDRLPVSVMAVPQVGLLDNLPFVGAKTSQDETFEEFLPEDVERIVGPLCGKTPAALLD